MVGPDTVPPYIRLEKNSKASMADRVVIVVGKDMPYQALEIEEQKKTIFSVGRGGFRNDDIYKSSGYSP